MSNLCFCCCLKGNSESEIHYTKSKDKIDSKKGLKEDHHDRPSDQQYGLIPKNSPLSELQKPSVKVNHSSQSSQAFKGVSFNFPYKPRESLVKGKSPKPSSKDPHNENENEEYVTSISLMQPDMDHSMRVELDEKEKFLLNRYQSYMTAKGLSSSSSSSKSSKIKSDENESKEL